MPSIELYWSPGTCARVPFVALEHAGVPFELRTLNRYTGDFEAQAYGDVNPKRRVPALVLDGTLVTENPIIQMVLARTFPEAQLLPTDGDGLLTEALSMLGWFASELHPAVARQRLPWIVFDGDPRADPEAGSSLKSVVRKARQSLERAFALLESRLADRDWLFDKWSTIDVYMLWLWFRAVGSGMNPTPFSRCADHAARTEALPAVARVLDHEERVFSEYEAAGLVSGNLPAFQVGRVPLSTTVLAAHIS